jgi:AcrR family transcriptional regulator
MIVAPPPGRTRTAVARGEARRTAIVDAAIDLIAAHGATGFTLADVGAAAGVTRAGVLHHFATKEAVLEAALDAHQRFSAPVFPRIAEPGGIGSILALVEIARKDAADRRQLALWNRLVAESLDPGAPLHDRIQRSYRAMVEGVRGFLRDARERGELRDDVDIDLEATALLAFLNGLETSWLLDPRVPIVEVAERHLAQVVARIARG